jgi:cytochrome b involved in lipid metabolism
MNKKVVMGVLIFLFAIFFVYFIRINQGDDLNGIDLTNESIDYANNFENLDNQQLINNPTNKVNLNQIGSHNSESDCWVVFRGKVYDITSYLPRHPGSAGKIIPYCGNDGFEEAFVKKHGETKVNMLMKIGTFIGDFDVVGEIK